VPRFMCRRILRGGRCSHYRRLRAVARIYRLRPCARSSAPAGSSFPNSIAMLWCATGVSSASGSVGIHPQAAPSLRRLARAVADASTRRTHDNRLFVCRETSSRRTFIGLPQRPQFTSSSSLVKFARHEASATPSTRAVCAGSTRGRSKGHGASEAPRASATTRRAMLSPIRPPRTP
jgi:hypothetical protein